MSTHHSLGPGMRRHFNPALLTLLVGILTALQLTLPAFASTFSTTRITAPPLPASAALARSEAAVVRIVTLYTSNRGSVTSTPSAISSVACTGLGVLVASWTPTSTTEQNTWVLTDGALLNNEPGCAQSNVTTLSPSIQVYASTFYNQQPVALTQSFFPTTFTCSSTPAKQSCAGIALFAFHTNQPLPFITVSSNKLVTPSFALELTQNGQTPPSLSTRGVEQYVSQMPQFLTPTQILASRTTTTGGSNEAGAPFVDSSGQLAGIHVTGSIPSLPAAAIQTFLATKQTKLPYTSSGLTPSPQRDMTLNSNWNLGLTNYYKTPPDYVAARSAFQSVAELNSRFAAPSLYLNDITTKLSQGNQKTTPGGGGTTNSSQGISGLSFNTLLLAIAGLVVLIVLLVLGGLILGRMRAHRRELARFKDEQAQAERIATANVDMQRRQQAPAVPAANKVSTPRSSSPANLACPNCGQPVQSGTDQCPNCRYLLSPSASGLHLRATLPAPAAADAPMATNPVSPVPSQPLPSNTLPLSSVSEMPTMRIPSNGETDAEKTAPYTVEQVSGRNLSLAVGTRTDPGIKRKHKPNEDSLFAMQGSRTHNTQSQQFGLFVVADGMGGQANGQDASRLAIQTIVNFLLPPLSRGDPMQDEEFTKLLADGVQQANQAVYNRNIEQRSDMGTTMTAALVIGAVAYVANVGDSRTYLYREPEGLTKITRDHSVVASLVDAGVIKPDDIYTHPKRNQIYRSLGEKQVVEVDTFKVLLQPGDKLLLCSDGLWDMVRDPDIQRIMRNPVPNPEQTGNALIKAALEGGGEDNVSVIIIHITEATKQTGMTGIQLLAKPDTVSVPNMS